MISSYANYTAAVNSPYQGMYKTKSSITTVQGRSYSLWTTAQDAGGTPTTASGLSNLTTGSFGQLNSATALWLPFQAMDLGNPGCIMVADRLAMQGGLSATVTGLQNVNLPTAALPRYTSGSGVQAAVEIYTQIGTTGTTIKATGTFSDGTTGTSPVVTFGGTGYREASRFIILPLPAGKTGWQQITSVFIAASTTTAGNFGVTLFKPLSMLFDYSPGNQFVYDGIVGSGGNLPYIAQNACLFYIVMSNATSSGSLVARHVLIEG